MKTINVEANLTKKIAKTIILPAALRYQRELAETGAAIKAVGGTWDNALFGTVSELVSSLTSSIGKLETVTAHEGAHGVVEEAKHFCDKVLPAMLDVRKAADTLEGIVADDVWPLPTYQEMLFIK